MITENDNECKVIASADFMWSNADEVVIMKYTKTHSLLHWASGYEKWVENSSVNVLQNLGKAHWTVLARISNIPSYPACGNSIFD